MEQEPVSFHQPHHHRNHPLDDRPMQRRRRFLRWHRWRGRFALIGLACVFGSGAGWAQSTTQQEFSAIATLWLLLAAALVFFMNAGFALLEAGFCRHQNATNVLAKNLIVFCVATLAFWLLGFGLMFGDSSIANCVNQATEYLSFYGEQGFFFNLEFSRLSRLGFPEMGFTCLQQDWPQRSFAALFFFQLVFAGTAATIVSGAVAERIRFWAFMLFSFFLVGIVYPLTGHWVWGHYGWLGQALQFRDFAGSTVVHSVGGMAALMGAWLLQPRQGRFGYDLRSNQLTPSQAEEFSPGNLGFATLGCLILWLGWFGFNGGSTIELDHVAYIIVTTMMAAAAGGIAAILFSPIVVGKPSLGSIINGILGGLVAVTASSAYIDLNSAFTIGAISGIVVLLGEAFLEYAKIDDPVGAIPVHLFCGFWGTLAVGLFSRPDSFIYAGSNLPYQPIRQTFCQCLGWLIICMVTALFSAIAWITIGLVLHYTDQINQWLSATPATDPITEGSDRPSFFLGRWLITQFQLGRRGIRVSLDDELSGSDGVFYNP